MDIWKAINIVSNKNNSSNTLSSSRITCDAFSNFFKTDRDQLKATTPNSPNHLSLLSAFCECATAVPSDITLITTTEVFAYFIDLKNNISPGL